MEFADIEYSDFSIHMSIGWTKEASRLSTDADCPNTFKILQINTDKRMISTKRHCVTSVGKSRNKSRDSLLACVCN
jgi:hypothetical protein